MGQLELSQEEREKRSERAKALHAAGKFGGPQPGSGRPRKKRASEIIAEQVSDQGQAIFDKLMEIVREGTHSNAIAAGRELLAIEKMEADRQERDDKRVEDMHRDELLAYVAAQFGELVKHGAIPDIIDGFATEVEDDGSSRPSEISSTTG